MGAHKPPLQKSPVTQFVSSVQPLGHADAAPPHTYGVHAGRPGAPAALNMQVPGVDAHSLHAPVQGLEQQKPSAQLPETHIAVRVHTAPRSSLVTHAPAWQNRPAAQPESCVQTVGHEGEAPSHTNGAQAGTPADPAATAVHVPGLESQRSQAPAHAVLQQKLSTQLPLAHSPAPPHALPLTCLPTQVPPEQYEVTAQSPSPVQVVRQVAEAPPHAYGAHEGEPGVPAATGVHEPGVVSQRSHAPVQPASQQKPSAQKPLAHSLLAWHESPSSFTGMQVDTLQKKPVAQLLSATQLIGQLTCAPLQA